jgi:hypothetical protein
MGRPEEAQEILQAAGRVPDGVKLPHGCYHSVALYESNRQGHAPPWP